MTLQQELNAFLQRFLERMPPQTVALMQQANDDLRVSGILERACKIGDLAPRFTLPNALGQSVSLDALLSTGPLVVSFYRGGWCPYCNLELRAYQQVLPQIRVAGGQLVAISPQTPDHSLSTAQKNSLEFEVLSDRGSEVAAAFGIAFELPDALKALYTQFKHPLPEMNGTPDWRLPIPATYVIAPDRRIVLAHVDTEYRSRLEPMDVLPVLQGLRKPAQAAFG